MDEVAVARDADDLAVVDAAVRDDPRARKVGMVGVADVDRNACAEGRHDGLVVEDAEAGVCEFAHFSVGHLGDAVADIGDDARVDGVDRVDVREVLVALGLHRGGENGAGDVASATRESGDLAVAIHAEESREDDNRVVGLPHHALNGVMQEAVGDVAEDGVAGFAFEKHAGLGRVDVGCGSAPRTECGGDELGRVVLAGGLEEVEVGTGIRLVGVKACAEVGGDLFADSVRKTEVALDGGKSLDDGLQVFLGVESLKCLFGQCNKHVRDLRVALAALARRRNHNDTPLPVREHDVADLGHLGGVSH